MALPLFVIGLMLLVSAAMGSPTKLFGQIWTDLESGYVYMVIAIVAVWALGQIPALKHMSNMFLVLIILAFVLANRGFVGEFEKTFGLPNTMAAK